MSSISVGELKNLLDEIPDDWEVIIRLRELDQDGNRITSLAYINGFSKDDDFHECYIMN